MIVLKTLQIMELKKTDLPQKGHTGIKKND